jgi:hypothetical protein
MSEATVVLKKFQQPQGNIKRRYNFDFQNNFPSGDNITGTPTVTITPSAQLSASVATSGQIAQVEIDSTSGVVGTVYLVQVFATSVGTLRDRLECQIEVTS